MSRGLVGILLGLGVLVWLSFRGWSVLVLAPVAAMIAAAAARSRCSPTGRSPSWARRRASSCNSFRCSCWALLLAIPALGGARPAQAAAAPDGLGARRAARTGQLWLLLAIYALCGLDDFFVSTHVVAFAQDRGLEPFLAGNLLALMGLTALVGVVVSGAGRDRWGPAWPTAASFAARVAVFALIMVDQSTGSAVILALVFGATFLVTAPLTPIFVAQSFGQRNLGGLTGLIIMVHHTFGSIGAYLGATTFDRLGGNDVAFAVMMASNVVALALTLRLRRPAGQA